MEHASRTCDLIADDIRQDGDTLSGILNDMLGFEKHWISYPKSNDDVVRYKPNTMTSSR